MSSKALKRRLREAAGDDDPGLIIAIGELLGIAALVAKRRTEWLGCIVLYAGDNTNVIG